MKILIIIGGFFPGKKYGGPPVSIDNFCTLMSEYDCYIVAYNHDLGDIEPYEDIESNKWISRNNCQTKYLNDKDYNKKTFISIIKEIKPDLLYLQGIFQECNLPCLELAKKFKIPVLLAPRGELCKGAFKKKYKKIPYIYYLKIKGLFKNISFQSTSDEETNAIRNYLNCNKIYNLSNIPSIPRKKYDMLSKKEGQAKFIFLSRIVSKKNLLFAIECFQNIIGDVHFDIYGSIENPDYWNECKNAVNKLPPNIKVNYRGNIYHDKVHQTFSEYHFFLFPTQSENYGHVIAESLMVGTPVIISDQTPWTDINSTVAGRAISLDNKNEYIEYIQFLVECNDFYFKNMRNSSYKYIEKKCQLKNLKNNYRSVIDEVIKCI